MPTKATPQKPESMPKNPPRPGAESDKDFSRGPKDTHSKSARDAGKASEKPDYRGATESRKEDKSKR